MVTMRWLWVSFCLGLSSVCFCVGSTATKPSQCTGMSRMAFGGVDEEASELLPTHTRVGVGWLWKKLSNPLSVRLSYDLDCLGIACVCTVRAQCMSKSRMTILRVAMMPQNIGCLRSSGGAASRSGAGKV
ncbi:hypothetical protein ACE6H2_015908 [Prunus campanulata]